MKRPQTFQYQFPSLFTTLKIWTRSGGTYDEGRETELTSLEDMQVNCEIG